jgi:predicted dehydrogenase
LENPDIHAVVIATSDHNHAPIGIAAARAGKAIYSEKCFAHTIEQAEDYRDAVKRAGVVFQLGHQTRSGSMTRKVREAIGPGGIGPDGALGKVTLIESYTNRNDPNGAWVYRIPTDASPETIDWRRFLGSARRRDFDADRFFRWRKYWDYGTGLAGDLLTHEFDAIQQITGLGIPDTCFSTGGIHYWRDGRETPDTLQATYHYEREELLVTYAATLANGWRREIRLLGHDATLDMTGGARMHVDPDSDRYAARIEKGEWEIPIGDEADIAAREEIRAATEDTRRWTVDKGIYVDVVGGVEVNVTALHILNFVEAVRGEVEATNCGIDTAFEEAVIAHMATISMQRGRRVRWDRRRERVVNDG